MSMIQMIWELNPQHLGRLVLQKGLPGKRTNLGEMPSGIWSESKMTTDMVDLPSQNKRTHIKIKRWSLIHIWRNIALGFLDKKTIYFFQGRSTILIRFKSTKAISLPLTFILVSTESDGLYEPKVFYNGRNSNPIKILLRLFA